MSYVEWQQRLSRVKVFESSFYWWSDTRNPVCRILDRVANISQATICSKPPCLPAFQKESRLHKEIYQRIYNMQTDFNTVCFILSHILFCIKMPTINAYGCLCGFQKDVGMRLPERHKKRAASRKTKRCIELPRTRKRKRCKNAMYLKSYQMCVKCLWLFARKI